MEENKKSGERPRRPRIGGTSSARPYSPERKQYGEGRPYGERKQYGENKPYGERKQYGESRPYGERKQYGESRPYGERKQYGENKPYGERKQYGESRPYGERKQYGEKKQYGESKPYGERKPRGEKKQFGAKKSFAKKPFDKRAVEAANEGINRMIGDRPTLSSEFYSDNDNIQIPVKDSERLNKFIANSGICSRREADQYIQAGVVTVNGEVITELGVKINPIVDDIRFNGQRLRGEEKVYIVMNKPKGYVTTAADPHADKTVMELLKSCPSRVFAVGRLDKNTTGVLMFTNDGEMAEKLTHPSYDKKKIYQVGLDHDLKQEDFDKINEGITLSDGEIAADDLQFIDAEDHRKIGIEIHSGKNRIVRRIFESLGYTVKSLDRVYFAGLTKKGLTRGAWRYLTEGEVNILKMGAYR